MAFRVDFGRLSKAQPTPQGGLRAPAYLTRTGIFLYKDASGREWRELRPAEEVFSTDSLETLKNCPITEDHPSGRVTVDNYRQLAVGTVAESSIRKDNIFIAAELVVNDRHTVDAIGAGKLKEISCGYDCEIELTSGEYEGQRYDAIQRNIRYNHVALGPANWGRAGNQVALKLDSLGIQQTEKTPMQTVIINGVTYTVGSPEHVSALEAEAKKANERADKAEAEAKTQRARADKAEGERDAARADSTRGQNEKEFQARLDASIALRDKARTVLGGETSLAGKTDREVVVLTIKKTDSSFDDKDKSLEYLLGRFDTLVTGAVNRSLGDVRRGAEGDPSEKTSPTTVNDAQEAWLQKGSELWRAPLHASKDANH